MFSIDENYKDGNLFGKGVINKIYNEINQISKLKIWVINYEIFKRINIVNTPSYCKVNYQNIKYCNINFNRF